MSKGKYSRAGVAVAAALAVFAGAFQPAAAAPVPVSRDLAAHQSVDVDQVQYRRYGARRAGRGNGAAAAAIIGALAIGATALAVSEQQRRRERRRARMYADPYAGGYAPQQYYGAPQYYQAQPQYYYQQPQPQYYGGGYRRSRGGHVQVDSGSAYAVQPQQRVRRGYGYAPQPYGMPLTPETGNPPAYRIR